jgi:hypothetical protein
MHGPVRIDDAVPTQIELGGGFQEPDRITFWLTPTPHPEWERIFNERAAATFEEAALEVPLLGGNVVVVDATEEQLRKTLEGLRAVLDATNQQWSPVSERLRARNATIVETIAEVL